MEFVKHTIDRDINNIIIDAAIDTFKDSREYKELDKESKSEFKRFEQSFKMQT